MRALRSASIGSLAAAAAAGVLLAGCSGSSPVVRPGGSSGPALSTATVPTQGTTPAPSTSTAPSASPTRHGTPAIKVVPATGLRATQTVRITGGGFTPHEALQAVECADKGTATGPGDCNLDAMIALQSDADGNVAAELQVVRGPFGANKITCSATQHCLVSVTQATLSPTEEANAAITFAR